MAKNVGFYAVKEGVNPGIYLTWKECQAQVMGYSGAKFKKFNIRADADKFVNGAVVPESVSITRSPDVIIVYADGSALLNGPNDARNVSRRVPNTEPQTNQRAELLAAKVALEITRDEVLPVEIRTDSKYVINGSTVWLDKWKKNGFKTSLKCNVLHADVWREISSLMQERSSSVI
jgi:ribonuclease HI